MGKVKYKGKSEVGNGKAGVKGKMQNKKKDLIEKESAIIAALGQTLL
jgi:hypothetical protein